MLSDYGINGELAVIAGVLDGERRNQLRERSRERPDSVFLRVGDDNIEWRPLTDWSQLGPLVEAYRLIWAHDIGCAINDGGFLSGQEFRRQLCEDIIMFHGEVEKC